MRICTDNKHKVLVIMLAAMAMVGATRTFSPGGFLLGFAMGLFVGLLVNDMAVKLEEKGTTVERVMKAFEQAGQREEKRQVLAELPSLWWSPLIIIVALAVMQVFK
jgi:hypothetical protein